jgi:D-xylose transport system substrate-binding protein
MMSINSSLGSPKRRAIATSLMALLVGLVATACASSTEVDVSDSVEDAGSDRLTIGLAMKTQLQKRWQLDEAAMQEECKAQGAECVVQWANDDATAQVSQVENLLSQGVDALVVVPVNGEAGKALVAAAHNQGVPVVDHDEFVPGSDFFVTRDNEAVGRAQAERALEFAPTGNWAIIKGDPGNPVAQEIDTGYKEVLEDADINVVYNQFTKNWDPAVAQTTAEGVLSANNDNIDVFLVSNDGMATGVVQALRSRNLGGAVYVSGLDADVANLQLIKDGLQTMTVWTDLELWSSEAIKAAVALANGEEVTGDVDVEGVPTRLIPITIIDQDNLCEFVTNDAPEAWVTVEDVYGSSSC